MARQLKSILWGFFSYSVTHHLSWMKKEFSFLLFFSFCSVVPLIYTFENDNNNVVEQKTKTKTKQNEMKRKKNSFLFLESNLELSPVCVCVKRLKNFRHITFIQYFFPRCCCCIDFNFYFNAGCLLLSTTTCHDYIFPFFFFWWNGIKIQNLKFFFSNQIQWKHWTYGCRPHTFIWWWWWWLWCSNP